MNMITYNNSATFPETYFFSLRKTKNLFNLLKQWIKW